MVAVDYVNHPLSSRGPLSPVDARRRMAVNLAPDMLQSQSQ